MKSPFSESTLCWWAADIAHVYINYINASALSQVILLSPLHKWPDPGVAEGTGGGFYWLHGPCLMAKHPLPTSHWVIFARGGGAQTSPAFPWDGFCNRLASGLQSSLLWSPASQNPLPCKHQQYEAYSCECFFTNISNTRVFRFEITPEDSSTKSWEQGHTTNASSPSPFISPCRG